MRKRIFYNSESVCWIASSKFMQGTKKKNQASSVWVLAAPAGIFPIPAHIFTIHRFTFCVPALNKLHMVLRATLVARRAACSAVRLTIQPDFAQWLHLLTVTGCACFWLSKKKKNTEEAQGQNSAHSILLHMWQLKGLSEADFGCRVRG